MASVKQDHKNAGMVFAHWLFTVKEACSYQETHTPVSLTHLSATSIQPPEQQRAHNTWQPAGEVDKSHFGLMFI